MTARVAVLVMPAWMPGFVPEGVTPACREPDVDPELFFPIAEKYSDEGRQVCRRCSLEVECGEWAIRAGERYGMWGGLTPEERAVRRRVWELTS